MKFTITTRAGTVALESPGDWFDTHAKVLDVMGIKDAGPVASEAEAGEIGEASRMRAENARARILKSPKDRTASKTSNCSAPRAI